MLESLLLLGFCALMGVIALGVCVYVAAAGQLFTLDGLLLVIISLTIGGIFMLNVAWSAYAGELKALLNHLKKKTASDKSSGDAS